MTEGKTELSMLELDFDDLRTWFGFGVAGNFAGHLEQAGEAADFVNVASEGAPGQEAPKGIFPWYAPGSDGFLGEFPLSHDAILLPDANPDGGPLNLQIEPDIGDLTPDGPTSTLRLVCNLRTAAGEEHAYGVDSPLLGYSYYGEVLLDWVTERLANQKGSPETPLEDVGALMVASGHPENVLIGIGATRYTPLGESTFLKAGDQAIVRVYDTESDAYSELRQTVSG